MVNSKHARGRWGGRSEEAEKRRGEGEECEELAGHAKRVSRSKSAMIGDWEERERERCDALAVRARVGLV